MQARLAAGKGDAAFTSPVAAITLENLNDIVDGINFAADFQGFRSAILRAFKGFAPIADLPVDDGSCIFEMQPPSWT